MLVGNKTDLHMERMISSDEGRRLADEWKAIFLETSAKQNSVSVETEKEKKRNTSKVGSVFTT